MSPIFLTSCEVGKSMFYDDVSSTQSAVSTAHAAQSNTIEHPLATEWRKLQIYQERELEALLKVKSMELAC